VVLESWIGMRGIVSLASALALPLTRGIGHPFPFRAEIILVAFIVILVTLVLQGLSIAPMLRRLHFRADDTLDREEAHARAEATEAALHRLHVLTREGWAPPDELEGLRLYYHDRQRRTASAEKTAGASQSTDAYRRLRHEALMAERARLIQLRNRGEISDDILQRLEFELDVEALRIGTGETRMRGAS
jgi:CPA1 family monovalent cation:H+ antiporter